MRNLKFIVGFTLTGFVLSLFCGFFSHSSFLRVILQAFLFAIIFALLAIIIQVLFDKFLDDGSAAGETDGVIAQESHSSVPQKGSKVDFVIQDEELPVSESENRFFVGENHQLLNESDVKKSSPQENSFQSQSSNGFVPLQKESFENLSEKEAKSPNEVLTNASQGFSSLPESDGIVKNAAQNVAAVNSAPLKQEVSSNSEGGIDALPDMNEVSFKSEDDEDSEVESPFTSETGSSRSSSRAAEGVDAKDASLLAKAISSILSGDS